MVVAFVFNGTATTVIYTLSLHDALPISPDELVLPTGADLAAKLDPVLARAAALVGLKITPEKAGALFPVEWRRSEEHTSELQSRLHLVCRLLLEKKKQPMPLGPLRLPLS